MARIDVGIVGKRYATAIANGTATKPFGGSSCGTRHVGRIRNDGGYDRRYNHRDVKYCDKPRLFVTIFYLSLSFPVLYFFNWLPRGLFSPVAGILLFLVIARIPKWISHYKHTARWSTKDLLAYMMRDAPFGWWFLTGGLAMTVLPLILLHTYPAIDPRWNWQSGVGLQLALAVPMIVISIFMGIRMRNLVSRVA